ncbi:retron Ec67 family RNA-directed DNA polymerase/endonuclease [Necropsobacter massiliensis]|uniref:retron Ec67 family RNA-directed DNA polymerase/endonuclease n=1 Tax=Necropsobacter massiliensis TaxID=1400001 RepID=UPI0006600438|nr:retron Ec67 family RNA-directed DNA polymerase/endonuclease [Necropsobacter massiliensis]
MNALSRLKNCNSIADIISSFSLNISPKNFSYILYILSDNDKYKEFTIPKSDSSIRTISCPEPRLKYLQKEFSKIINDCVIEIQHKNPSYLIGNHAFEKYKSIASNAYKHEKQRYILNIDIENFFSSIHYGRVVGFLQNDRYFSLSEKTSKIIAKLATHKGVLPQGSPLSPILASLIGNIVDSRLMKLARKYKLTYTRYADDITFSSNRNFSTDLLTFKDGIWVANKKLISAINHCGFKINHKKTRFSDQNHKRVVTGVIVNEFLNTDKKYRKNTRAMVNSLLSKGEFKILDRDNNEIQGTIEQLIGRLNHSISIKYRDRVLNPRLPRDVRIEVQNKIKENLIKIIQYKENTTFLPKNIGLDKIEKAFNIEKDEAKYLLSFVQKRDDRLIIPDCNIRLLRNVLFYKYFLSMDKPVIITEGKTDALYFKAAMKKLLISNDLYFVKHKKNGELDKLGLTGGTAPINAFFKYVYNDNNFVDFHKINVKPKSPVIFILDYDDGLDKVKNLLKKNFSEGKRFSQIKRNIYILLLNKFGDGEDFKKDNKVCIENLISFDGEKIAVSNERVSFQGKELSKNEFSKIVLEEYERFDFTNFSIVFSEINNIINHFNYNRD